MRGFVLYNVNRVRNARVVSHTVRHILGPVARVCDMTARHIRSKVWINGGTVRYGDVELTFPPGVGVHYATPIFWNGLRGYEPFVWTVLRELLRSGTAFADVGSNIGLYSVLASKAYPHLSVRAFEPVASLVAKNLLFQRANGVQIQVETVALSDCDGPRMVRLPVNVPCRRRDDRYASAL